MGQNLARSSISRYRNWEITVPENYLGCQHHNCSISLIYFGFQTGWYTLGIMSFRERSRSFIKYIGIDVETQSWGWVVTHLIRNPTILKVSNCISRNIYSSTLSPRELSYPISVTITLRLNRSHISCQKFSIYGTHNCIESPLTLW